MPRPNTKTEVVRLRVTTKEKAKLQSQASKRGESLSAFIKSKTLKE
jgi:hypothetical protein